MLETPSIPRYSPAIRRQVKMRRVRTISREDSPSGENPQRLHARQGREARKIQSELHGDMQSQAEMT